MAESALSLGYAEISTRVARYGLGYPSDPDAWSAPQLADILVAIDKGYADFLAAYEWRFLRQFATIRTNAPYSTGTIAVTDGDATVTLTTGVWPSWAASGVLIVGSREFRIATRTSNTDVELAEVFGGDTATGQSYSLQRMAYDLPDDFGQIASFFTFDAQHGRSPLDRVSPSEISARRSGSNGTSIPRIAAIRPKAHAGTAGQRMEALFFPCPDGEYALGYGYTILQPNKIRTETPYPIGGQGCAEAICDCAIAAARYYLRAMPLSDYRQTVAAAVMQAVQLDERNAATHGGYNGDRSDARCTHWSEDSVRAVTVNGVTPD